MSIITAVILTICIYSAWATIWLVIYMNSSSEPDWMVYMVGGPIMLLFAGICSVIRYIRKLYYIYNWKAVVVNDTGNKYWCNSKEQDEVCEQHNVKPAFEYVKTIEYKPYKPKFHSNFYQKNPRYIHRSVACKFPKLSCIEEVKTK